MVNIPVKILIILHMALIELKMPALGEGIIEATVLKWLKQIGEPVEEEEMVLEIATDKVDSEVPSTVTGILKEFMFKENEVAPVGATIALIETELNSGHTDNPQDSVTAIVNDTKGNTPADSSESDPAETTAVPYIPEPSPINEDTATTVVTNAGDTDNNGGNNGFYSPLVMSIAQKEGLSEQDLATLAGTGMEGRLTKKDILDYLQNRNDPGQNQLPGKARPENFTTGQSGANGSMTGPGHEIIEMDRMRKLIAHHMKESQNISATVTSFAEVDVTHMVQWRNRIKKEFEQREKTKITFTPLFIDCVTRTIKRYPLINSSVDGDRIIIKKQINIGMATALPNGNLIVPVIKNADHLNLVGLSKAVNATAEKARTNQLKPTDTQDGTFTITNVGSFGSLTGTPIINQPQVDILAIGTIKKRPVVIESDQGDAIGIRHMMILALSYDHRIIDGALGSRFLGDIVREIEAWDLHRSY